MDVHDDVQTTCTTDPEPFLDPGAKIQFNASLEDKAYWSSCFTQFGLKWYRGA